MDQKLTLCPLTFIYLLINIIIIIIQAFEPNTILRLTGRASNWIEPASGSSQANQLSEA